MALRILMLKRSIDKKKEELELLRSKDSEFETREAELEAAINEAETPEQEQAVSEEVEKFDADKSAHEEAKARCPGKLKAWRPTCPRWRQTPLN